MGPFWDIFNISAFKREKTCDSFSKMRFQVIKFPHPVDRGVQQVSSRVSVEQKNQPSATNRDHAKQPLSQALQRDNEPAATGFPWPGASGIDCASGADPSFPPTRPQSSAPGDNRDSARSARLFTRC